MKPIAIFKNRWEAGERLAERLVRYHCPNLPTLALGIRDDGLPVAAAVAQRLQIPLDIALVEPLLTAHGVEVGAVTATSLYLDPEAVARAQLTPRQLDVARARAVRRLIGRRTQTTHTPRATDLHDVQVFLISDIAPTSIYLRATAEAVRRAGATHVVAAAPLAADAVRRDLVGIVDEFVSIGAPLHTASMPSFYADFAPVPIDDVRPLLEAAAERPWFAGAGPGDEAHGVSLRTLRNLRG